MAPHVQGAKTKQRWEHKTAWIPTASGSGSFWPSVHEFEQLSVMARVNPYAKSFHRPWHVSTVCEEVFLARAEETIERIGGHMQATDDNISGARRVMIQMYRRAMATWLWGVLHGGGGLVGGVYVVCCMVVGGLVGGVYVVCCMVVGVCLVVVYMVCCMVVGGWLVVFMWYAAWWWGVWLVVFMWYAAWWWGFGWWLFMWYAAWWWGFGWWCLCGMPHGGGGFGWWCLCGMLHGGGGLVGGCLCGMLHGGGGLVGGVYVVCCMVVGVWVVAFMCACVLFWSAVMQIAPGVASTAGQESSPVVYGGYPHRHRCSYCLLHGHQEEMSCTWKFHRPATQF